MTDTLMVDRQLVKTLQERVADEMTRAKQLREARGWSQVDLAYRLGITPSAVYNWERGKHEPSASMLRKLARLFEVSMDDIELPGDTGGKQWRQKPHQGGSAT